jgi:2-hydroxycyclohexanecarboxyl-CoA dehydrogenase
MQDSFDTGGTMGKENRERVALVTGAGRGIGRAVALRLAREGFALCLCARTREELVETRRMTGLAPNRSLIVLLDLAESEAPAALLAPTIEHFGRIDVLVNNAGWRPPPTELIEMDADHVDRILAVDLRAPIALVQLAAGVMSRSGGGAIVNIASNAARRAPAGEAVYAAAKAGLLAFTHAASRELSHHGIKVAAIVPGVVDTALSPEKPGISRVAMLRPDDVAAAVMRVVTAPAGACPVEIALDPHVDPMGAGSSK